MKIQVDNREIETKAGLTVLDAAGQNDIYIPHLCSHPELTPYGGCRLCIVEIEGIRGFPTACTTIVKEGMKVRTQSDTLQEMRREILQLTLSEHPSGCLVCSEKEACADTMESIRKVGVTTGCRWCPKDGDCELQRVVQHLKIEEIKFPVYYQDLDVEKYDPFFDRDYNLCIYCARCVRICGEHRKSFVLTLNERGKNAFVGTAFHNTHIEAECEFCGACVSVCPTGALAEKSRKWSGVPSAYQNSFCPFCSNNCDIRIATGKGKIIGTIPPGDPHESGGELCVKGRFCLSEVVNHPGRLLEPQFRFPQGYGFISYEEALKEAAQRLQETPGKKTAFYLAPNLSLEELAAVKQFAGQVMDNAYITSTALTENMITYLALSEKSPPLDKIEEAEAIVSIFLEGGYAYGPVTQAIKRAAEKGAPLYRLGWTRDTTSRFAEETIAPTPGKEKNFFKKIQQALEKGSGGGKDIKELVEVLKTAHSIVLILGPQVAELTEGKDILEIIGKIATLTAAEIFAPNPYGNLTGMLAMLDVQPVAAIDLLVADKKIDLLYIIGDTPFQERPAVDFIIHQGSFPPPAGIKADLLLPTATWGEISGSYMTGQGKKKDFKAVLKPPGLARGSGEILADMAAAMGKKAAEFSPAALSKLIPPDLTMKYPESKAAKKPKVTQPDNFFPYLLVRDKPAHALHNIALSSIVPGMAAIHPEETILLHPENAAKLGLQEGDRVVVESAAAEKEYPIMPRDTITPGNLFLLSFSRPAVFKTNPCPVHIRRKNV